MYSLPDLIKSFITPKVIEIATAKVIVNKKKQSADKKLSGNLKIHYRNGNKYYSYKSLKFTLVQSETLASLTSVEKVLFIEKAMYKISQAKHNKLISQVKTKKAKLAKIEKKKAEVKVAKAKAEVKVVKANTLVSIEDPLAEFRTEEENKISVDYKPNNKVSVGAKFDNLVVQEISNIIETHIVASTLGKDGLTMDDFALNGKTLLSIIVDNIEHPTVLSPTVSSSPIDGQPYSYPFNQSHRIGATFTNRYKNNRIVENRNAITYNINLNINIKLT